MAEVLRSVLFVDFDNVFFSLQSADKDAAKAFANDPQGWLDAIENGALIDAGPAANGPVRRRILMRRCYANPAVMRYFRSYFTRSGFQIVDCPPLTGKGKNSADIYMVVDMLDAMRHETRFDEFIIMSGDADFTPVLTRLRAFDRRSVIYSNAVTAAAYKSLCDGMITEERLIDLAGAGEEETEPAARPERRPVADGRGERIAGPPPSAPESGRPPEPFRPAGEARPAGPPRRLHGPRSGPGPDDGGVNDGGRLPRLPAEIEPLVRRVTAATNVPPFAPDVYASLFRAMAAEVQERGFSLNRTVNGVIRRIADQGMRLRPQSVAFVVKGLMLSDHEFVPTDTPGTLAKAFRRQVLHLAANADLVLADQERSMVGAWILGALRSISASEATAAEDVASDPARAAEAAGVTIEETIHGMGHGMDHGMGHGMDPEPVAPLGASEPPAMAVYPDVPTPVAGDGAVAAEEPPRQEATPDASDTNGAGRPPRNIDDLLARIRSPAKG